MSPAPFLHNIRYTTQSVGRTQTALGAFYRRLKAKHGAPIAVTATAHKLARIVYHMLKHRLPYARLDIQTYQEQQRQRSLISLQRMATRLGFQLVPEVSPAVS